MANSTGDAEGRAWRHYALVAAVAAAVVFWQMGSSVLEDHECKLALSARAMAAQAPEPWIIESDWNYPIPPRTPLNRWMVPVENGRPRLVKTPLPYWVAARSPVVAAAPCSPGCWCVAGAVGG